MTNVYLSGPMTGLPQLNYPAFHDAAEHLRGVKSVEHVYNPAEWEELIAGEFDLKQAFTDYCFYIIWKADCVIVLPGWENSPGAGAEVALAKAIRKDVYAYSKEHGWTDLSGDKHFDHPTLFSE